MKRWITLCLLGFLVSNAGCALRDCCRRFSCCQTGEQAQTTPETEPRILPNRASPQAPLEMPGPLPPPETSAPMPKAQAHADSEPAIPRRLPAGNAKAANVGELAAPLIVQVQPETGPGDQGGTTFADLSRANRTVPVVAAPAAGSRIENVRPTSMLPKFLKPIPLSVEPASASESDVKATSAVPAIDPVQHAAPAEKSPLPREQRGEAVRYSHYLPLETTKETVEPPLADKAGPRTMSVFAVPEAQPAPRPAFGPAMPDAELSNRVSSLQFGPLKMDPVKMQEPVTEKLPEKKGELVTDPRLPALRPSLQAPTVVRIPSMQSLVRPTPVVNVQGTPAAKTPVAMNAPVIEQKCPFVPMPQADERVTLLLEPLVDLPPSIVPFVIVQELPKGVQRIDVSMLEPVTQTLIYRVIDETNARPPADLGPPEVSEQ